MVEQLFAAWGCRRLLERFRGSARDEAGVTAVEYGLLAAFLGVVFIAAGPLLAQALGWLRTVLLDGMVG